LIEKKRKEKKEIAGRNL